MKKQIVSESENIFLWLVKKKEKEKATSSFFKKKKGDGAGDGTL